MSKSDWMNSEKIRVQLHKDTYIYLSKMIECFFESIRGIYYHRVLNKYIKAQGGDWYEGHTISISSMCLDISIVTWSKLFGSEKAEDIHFMHLLKYPELQECLFTMKLFTNEELEKNLLTKIGIEKIDFDKYKNKSIIQYRDQFVAHMDLKLYIKSEDDKATSEDKKRNN